MKTAGAFLLPALGVLLLDLLAKLAAIAHLTPAVVDLADLDARRRVLATRRPSATLAAAWSARSPCAGRSGACPRQWLVVGGAALRYVENRGAAWGDPRRAPGPGARALLALASGATLLGAALGAHRRPDWAPLLGALAGGVAGNLVDRLRAGYVVDYLELHAGAAVGPVVNLADVVITAALVGLVARALPGSRDGGRRGRCRTPSGRVWRAPWHAAGRS